MGVEGLGGSAGLRIEENRMRSNSGQRWRSLGRWFGNRAATWHSPERMPPRTSPTATEWLEACRWMELAGP